MLKYRFYFSFFLYLAASYINLLMAINLRNPYQNKGIVLEDMGFRFLPLIPQYYANTLWVIFFIYFIIKWFHNKNILAQFFQQLAVLFMIRLICFSLTITPPAVPECVDPRKGNEIIWFADSLDYACVDNIFSGHVMHMTAILLFIMYYSNCTWDKYLIGVSYIPYILMVVASRMHYSVDVFIGGMMTTLVFLLMKSYKIFILIF